MVDTLEDRLCWREADPVLTRDRNDVRVGVADGDVAGREEKSVRGAWKKRVLRGLEGVWTSAGISSSSTKSYVLSVTTDPVASRCIGSRY